MAAVTLLLCSLCPTALLVRSAGGAGKGEVVEKGDRGEGWAGRENQASFPPGAHRQLRRSQGMAGHYGQDGVSWQAAVPEPAGAMPGCWPDRHSQGPCGMCPGLALPNKPCSGLSEGGVSHPPGWAPAGG